MSKCLIPLATLTLFLSFGTSLCIAANTITFDNGDTLFTPVEHDSHPGPEFQTGGPTGDFLRIVHDGINSNRNRIAFDRTNVGAANVVNAAFDFRIQDLTPAPADGLGFVLLNTANWGTSGVGSNTSSVAERPNFAGSLGIGFDVHPAPGTNDVSIQFGGQVASVNVAGIDLDDGTFHRANVVANLGAGTVSVSLTPDIHGTPGAPIAVFTNQVVAGLSPYESRVEFAGRTGGLNLSADVDNVNVSFDGGNSTTANFQHGFTSSVLSDAGGNVTAPQIMGGGPDGNFLRLVHDGVNNNRNRVAFDQMPQHVLGNFNQIVADFDFRIEENTPNPADGFGLVLLPTSVHGTSGDGTGTQSIAERPNFNIGGVDHFGLGFDVHPAPGTNDVNVQFGGEVINVNLSGIDLDDGNFHNAHLELVETAGEVFATLVLTPDTFGTPGAPVTAFEDLLIPGFELYDFRPEFLGRTGGLNVSVDLDNISVFAAPEPVSISIWCLLGVAATAAVKWRRRQRQCR